MAKIGYARVSTKEQNLERQLVALKEYGCTKIFQEKFSGKSKDDRLELQKMLSFIREDDEVVVISLDRLSRDTDDIDKILREIQSKDALFTALDLPSFNAVEDKNMRKMLNNLVLEVFKFTAQNERERILERQRQGIEVAKKNGVYERKLKYRADTPIEKDRYLFEQVVEMLRNKVSVLQISKKTGLSRVTINAIKKRENI